VGRSGSVAAVCPRRSAADLILEGATDHLPVDGERAVKDTAGSGERRELGSGPTCATTLSSWSLADECTTAKFCRRGPV
jgi:hypothetical protein